MALNFILTLTLTDIVTNSDSGINSYVEFNFGTDYDNDFVTDSDFDSDSDQALTLTLMLNKHFVTVTQNADVCRRRSHNWLG